MWLRKPVQQLHLDENFKLKEADMHEPYFKNVTHQIATRLCYQF
jgi:hypothetical protein